MAGLLPSMRDLRGVISGMSRQLGSGTDSWPADRPLFAPGAIVRSDGLPVDETLAELREAMNRDPGNRVHCHAVHERIASLSDLTPRLYDACAGSASSIMNWFPAVADAVSKSGAEVLLPATSLWRLPHELAQYTRLEYTETNAVSRETFDAIAVRELDLEVPGRYFVKYGGFSSKFEFANARCDEPEEIGQYLHAVNNAAMMLGAAHSVDVCAREYIEPEPGTPTIYHGMPLRTELRAFVDLGAEPRVLGITPYWHPSVMRRALDMAGRVPGMDHIRDDYPTYMAHEAVLAAGFDEWRDPVVRVLESLAPEMRAAGLSGAWSVDFMVNGDDLYLIDMALMATSALTELLLVTDEYSLVSPGELEEIVGELVLTDGVDPRVPEPGAAGSLAGDWSVSGTGTPAYRYRWREPAELDTADISIAR